MISGFLVLYLETKTQNSHKSRKTPEKLNIRMQPQKQYNWLSIDIKLQMIQSY